MSDMRLRMDKIMQVLHEHGLHWRDGAGIVEERVSPGESWDGAVYEYYPLEIEDTTALGPVMRMADAIACGLGARDVSVTRDGEQVIVRVAKVGRENSRSFWDMFEDKPTGYKLLLGEMPEGNPLWLDMALPENAHILVVGMTGSGKTTLMQAMAYSALLRGWDVALCDVGDGLAALSGMAGVWRGGRFSTPDTILYALEAQARVMQSGAHVQRTVFFDEVPATLAENPKIVPVLARLAEGGRKHGIHLVLGAQHPLVTELGAQTLRNMTVRIVGRVTDPQTAYQAVGRAMPALTKLAGRGDMVLVRGVDVQPFQAAYVPPDALAATVAERGEHLGRTVLYPMEEELIVRQRAGRQPDPIPTWVLDAIVAQQVETGSWPSVYWVTQFAREQTGKLWGYGKAKRAMAAAREREGCEASG